MAELDADQVATLLSRAKRQIRTRMRALRNALPESAVRARSEKIVQRLETLPAFVNARSIALFWPMSDRREVDLRQLDARARAADKVVYYPFMDPGAGGVRTGFRRLDAVDGLIDRGRGFCEPPPEAEEAKPGALDLIVVPALAVSEDGHRIGYGVGFYDATLPEHCPPAIALVVAFDFQLLAEAPHEAQDFRCNLVMTDARVSGVGETS